MRVVLRHYIGEEDDFRSIRLCEMATSCEEDRVSDLLAFPFSKMHFQQKLKLIEKGRPTPPLPGLVQVSKNHRRHFQASNYSRYLWLTGSPKTNKLYCWDCLLFNLDKGPWSSTGFCNLNCLTKAAVKHECTPGHLRATVSLKTFGDSNIDLQKQRSDVLAHNENVRQNREILKRLIHTVVFLGTQEMAFGGHGEGAESANRGNYLELLDYLAEYDSELRCHLATSKVFTGTSSKIQSDLVDATADVLRDVMKDEVAETPFVALLVDEAGGEARASTVLRYVTGGGVKERFFEFLGVAGNEGADATAARILSFLGEVGCAAKVVAQCYDGAAASHGVQARVKETIPQALFVHCYAHTLTSVMSQGAARIGECKMFFSHVDGLAAFFSGPPKRARLLDRMCQRRPPRGVPPARWPHSPRLVNVVFERRNELREAFAHIVEHHGDFDADTLRRADGYVDLFSKFEFRFLLATFSSVFAHSDALREVSRAEEMDVPFRLERIAEFCAALEKEGANFNAIYEGAVEEAGVPGARGEEDARAHYRQLHRRIIDSLLGQVRERFKDHERLTFLTLLDPEQFTGYRQSFPDAALSGLDETYGHHFDLLRLKTELSVMYAMSDFEALGPADLLRFLQQKGLTKSLHQLYRLTCLVLTIPVSTASVGNAFSALERIRAYGRNSAGQDRLSGAALLSIERGLLLELKSKDGLYDQAIAHFVKKNQTAGWILFSSSDRHSVPTTTQTEGEDDPQPVPTKEVSNVSEPTPQNTTQFLQHSAIYSIPLTFVISGPPKNAAVTQPTIQRLILPHSRTQPEVTEATSSTVLVHPSPEPVRKRMKMSHPDNPSPVNPVHLTKCLQKKLRKLLINKDNRDLEPWVKSLTHHLWWSCQTYDGSTQELKRRWTSILQHICDIHCWQEDGQERTCYHGSGTATGALQQRKKWLNKDSNAFKALSDLVLNFF